MFKMTLYRYFFTELCEFKIRFNLFFPPCIIWMRLHPIFSAHVPSIFRHVLDCIILRKSIQKMWCNFIRECVSNCYITSYGYELRNFLDLRNKSRLSYTNINDRVSQPFPANGEVRGPS